MAQTDLCELIDCVIWQFECEELNVGRSSKLSVYDVVAAAQVRGDRCGLDGGLRLDEHVG